MNKSFRGSVNPLEETNYKLIEIVSKSSSPSRASNQEPLAF